MSISIYHEYIKIGDNIFLSYNTCGNTSKEKNESPSNTQGRTTLGSKKN